MRVNPTLAYQLKKKEALQKKTDSITHKVAVAFILLLMILFFLKMLLPSHPDPI